MLSNKSQSILNKLQEKANNSSLESKRMPSLKDINFLLNEIGIKTSFRDSSNYIERRAGNSTYLIDRHLGKNGNKLTIKFQNKEYNFDSSDTYYSWNSSNYAREILNIINNFNFK